MSVITTAVQPPKTRWISIFLMAMLVVLTALMAAPSAFAESGFLTTWSNLYPGSASDNNASCQLCHGSSTQNINSYGFAMALCNGNSGSISSRIQAVEGQDSDGQGDSNLAEINASTQPGWTTGANPVWGRSSCNPAGTNTYPGAGDVDPVAAEPDIAVAPTTLTFGIVDVGNSNTLTTTITNNGTADLNVTSLNLSGTSEFALGAAPTTPFTVAPSAAASVDVVYTPTDNTTDAGSLAINSNDPDSPTVTVSLSGIGNVVVPNACNFSVNPASLAFGNVDIGTSPALTTTVTNNGTAACNITANVTGSADFALTSPAMLTVAANGGTADVNVSFTPADAGADLGNLNLTSDDINNPQSVDIPLSGTGVDAGDVCEGLNITRSEYFAGRDLLLVTGNGGEIDSGQYLLTNAYDPAQILGFGSRFRDRVFTFINRPTPVPCAVRVEQPATGLCAIADVANAPVDCAPQPPVGEALTARGDLYATPVGDTIAVTASRLSGVLYNDFGGVPPLTAQLVSGPTAGSLDAFGADGSFTYTPGATMTDNQTDQFTYVAVDDNGVTSDPATVVIQTLVQAGRLQDVHELRAGHALHRFRVCLLLRTAAVQLDRGAGDQAGSG